MRRFAHKDSFKTLFKILILIPLLSSCSIYPNKFKCKDAKGLYCRSLSEVDNSITNGEINSAYRSKCKGLACKQSPALEHLPLKKKPLKVKFIRIN